MWKEVLAGVLTLFVGMGSALAQPNQLTQVRNDSTGRWTFGFGCGSTVITLDPAQIMYLDMANLKQGCAMTAAPAPAKEAGSPIGRTPGMIGTQDSIFGVNKSGQKFHATDSTSIFIEAGPTDKTALVLLDGVELVAIPPSTARVPILTKVVSGEGPHTLMLIGTGKGTFNIHIGVLTKSGLDGAQASYDIDIPGSALAPVASATGDVWVITRSF